MQVELKIDETCKDPKVIIIADKMTDEIGVLLKSLSSFYPYLIAGFSGDTVKLLEENEIVRVYAANQKICAQTANCEYILRPRLYELEERLNKRLFVRISNSEIINLKKVIRLDLSMSGTICVELSNQATAYVARRYVTKIKQALGI